MTNISFRKELAYYVMKAGTKESFRGRPPIAQTIWHTRTVTPPVNLRREGTHLPIFSSVRGRCKYAMCTDMIFIKCQKM